MQKKWPGLTEVGWEEIHTILQKAFQKKSGVDSMSKI